MAKVTKNNDCYRSSNNKVKVLKKAKVTENYDCNISSIRKGKSLYERSKWQKILMYTREEKSDDHKI